ncbi:MAG: carbohydrate binding family 9 domain-containing protein [Gemmatimonadetes bacterium]|nr:carbohydrate binding family 9 domain-containing protein [Gemmatimonadota bacterium]
MRYLLLLLFLILPGAVHAQAGDPADAGHPAPPVVAAVPATSVIRIDGVLDEGVWQTAPAVTEFTQIVPEEGAAATERTEVRFAFSADALYIGARMYDRSRPITRLGRRDGSMAASDWLTIILDTYHDHRTAFGFEINPSGLRRDQTRSDSGEDDSWDPVWEAATQIDEEGWTAEIRIPFSQLRFNPSAAQVWGIQIERQIARNREFAVFSFTPTTQPGGIPRFGHLEGLGELTTGKRLELLPYSVLRGESIDRGDNPFRDNREVGVSVGADAKYRVTSDLTLDVTVNPDFGQVEVDPAQVNLTAIETLFQEKRPFFVEGSEIFNFGAGGGNNVFYSRRIGRAPQILPPSQRRDVPEATRILGAAKLSGRTAGGWSIGMLNALTDREHALYMAVDDAELRTTAEPLSNYFVGRLRRDMRAGLSTVGGMLTMVHRDLDTDPLRASLRSAAYTGGIDFRHEWAERTWSLTGFLSGSHVQGSPEAILIAQRSPWRYFQRPDADHLDLDPTRTALAGLSTQGTLQYRRGRHWRYALLAGTTTPQYEVNDIGFQYRADRVDGQATVTYVEPRPGSLFRSWNVSAVARAERNYAFETVMNRFYGNLGFQTLNYWNANLLVGYTTAALDDRLTRGGPSSRRPAQVQVNGHFNSDSRRRVSTGGGFGYARNEAGGWGGGGGIGITVRPAPNWTFSTTPTLEWSHTVAQYRGARPDVTATHTYGARYLFASLEQTTLSMETRLDVTFTPDLSLQIYAQPYIASADFGAPAELRAPGVYDFLVYGRDIGEIEPVDGGTRVYPQGRDGDAAAFTVPHGDFTLRSLRGNAVLRWEYRPGSTIFVAWQQNRSGADASGQFDFSRDRAALFDAPPDDVFVVKVSYWINP